MTNMNVSYCESILVKLKGNETPPTNNNRSRGAGGVNIDSVNTTIDFYQ